MSFISVVAPQRTWSPTQPPWRSATQRWDAISRSLPTPTTLPTMNCRHDTRRTCMKLWARCRRFITDWHLAQDTRTRLLPQTKTAIRLCPCSEVAVTDPSKHETPTTGHTFSFYSPFSWCFVAHSQDHAIFNRKIYLYKSAIIFYF